MAYKVEVTDECIGCGACVGVCDEGFELVNGKSKPKQEVTELECVNEAAEVCPVNAIKAEEN